MPVLQNTITEPDGTPLDGFLQVDAVGSPFRQDGQSEVLGPLLNRSISGGTWQVELAPGLYKVTERRLDGSFHSVWGVDLPDSADPVWLADALSELPGVTASAPLLGVAGLTIDGSGHLIVTYTDGSTQDAGLVQGPPGPVGPAGGVTSVAGKSGVVTLVAADVTDFAEAGQDMLAAALVAGTNVTLSYNDAAGTLTIAVPSAGGTWPTNPAGSVGFVLQNADGSWPNRLSSRTDVQVRWVKRVVGSSDPASAVSPAVNGAYQYDIVEGV